MSRISPPPLGKGSDIGLQRLHLITDPTHPAVKTTIRKTGGSQEQDLYLPVALGKAGAEADLPLHTHFSFVKSRGNPEKNPRNGDLLPCRLKLFVERWTKSQHRTLSWRLYKTSRV